MNSIISTLRNIFGGKDKTESTTESNLTQADILPPREDTLPLKTDTPASEVEETQENFPEQEQKRMVIQPPIVASDEAILEIEEILIKAQPSATMDQCKFMVNRNLIPSQSWYFKDFESAAGSSLAESLFSIEGVETVLVHESTVTLTRIDKSSADWRPIAEEAGNAIREKIQSGEALISNEVLQSIPAEEVVRSKIQEVIDLEVNPGVAGHGGRITLTKVEGNTVTIQMGGGCQGCSAADMTLKQGIHNAFRKALPTLGAIYDETDHKSGLNPYYS